MLVSAPSRWLLLREDVWQLVLLVMLDEGLYAHILQHLLRVCRLIVRRIASTAV
jgi:hypothetical protein